MLEVTDEMVEIASIIIWRRRYMENDPVPPEEWRLPFRWQDVPESVKDSKYRSAVRKALEAIAANL